MNLDQLFPLCSVVSIQKSRQRMSKARGREDPCGERGKLVKSGAVRSLHPEPASHLPRLPSSESLDVLLGFSSLFCQEEGCSHLGVIQPSGEAL